MSHTTEKIYTAPILRTISCDLCATEDVLRKVWEEMTQKNTPLIVKLLKFVSEQPEFETYKENGTITKKEITNLRKILIEDSDLKYQSGRLRTSADSLVTEVYSSVSTTLTVGGGLKENSPCPIKLNGDASFNKPHSRRWINKLTSLFADAAWA